MKILIKAFGLLLMLAVVHSLRVSQALTHEEIVPNHFGSKFSFLLGTKLTFIKDVKSVLIIYKYGSVFGYGGDKSCTYNLRIYKSQAMGVQVNVFVASYYSLEKIITINSDVQYGVDKEVMFLVKHREQKKHGIYQWRFTNAAGGLAFTKNAAVLANFAFRSYLRSKGLPPDLSWIAGDPLRNF